MLNTLHLSRTTGPDFRDPMNSIAGVGDGEPVSTTVTSLK